MLNPSKCAESVIETELDFVCVCVVLGKSKNEVAESLDSTPFRLRFSCSTGCDHFEVTA